MLRWATGGLAAVWLWTGCEQRPAASPPTAAIPIVASNAPSAAGATLSAEQVMAHPELVHARLKARNQYYQGEGRFAENPDVGLAAEIVEAAVVDLSPLQGLPFGALDLRATPVADLAPLAGMPLRLLALEQTRVTDLTPLKGMKLQKLYLNQTSVRDLTPLAGMPLVELMAVDAQIEDLTPLEGAPLEGLWLNRNPVTNVAPLARSPLITLTLEGTRVTDLGPLAAVKSLQRLHIGETPVRDLAPLAGLRLTRLIFNPARITNGLEAIRGMSSLEELGTTLEGRMPPARFWEQVK
jgi:internalin A